MTLDFFKYHGTGNDFIILDNRQNNIVLTTKQIRFFCNRRFGIGADGLMLLNLLERYDFEMKYYNSDGNESSMCGNGGRCMVKFAYHLGMHKSKYFFKAVDGDHEAILGDNDWVNLKMKDVSGIKKQYLDSILNTGSPHYVKPIRDLRTYDVVKAGRDIRNSNGFK